MILVAGEALIDLTRGPDGRYTAHPGGGPCNTAVGLGRLGVPVAFLGGLGRDHLGHLLRDHLAGAGVDLDMAVDTGAPTTLAVATVDADGVAEYSFHLTGTSSAALTADTVPDPIPADVTAVWYGTLGLVIEPTATTLIDLVARNAGRLVVGVDPNLRPSATPDLAGHLRRMTGVIAGADIVKLSADDAALLRPGADPEATVRWVRDLGPRLVLLTRGRSGVVAATGDGIHHLAVPEAPVVDTIGAGDAYAAGVLAALHDRGRLTKPGVAGLSLDDLAAVHDFATAVAAVTVGRAGADPPWRAEM